MRPVLVFDVNETLLDLRGMHAPFDAVFGDGSLRAEWFSTLLRKMFVTTIAGPYVDFVELGAAALEHVATQQGRALTPAEQTTILEGMRQLPPHDDVVPALERLRAGAYRCVALSNGRPDALAEQLDHAGLTRFFERVASAEAAGRLKPAPEPYQWLAGTLDVPTNRLCMVAAHAWDTTGAQRAGCTAAFVARPGKRLSAVDPRPGIVEDSLTAVADRLLARPDPAASP
jgi:2-haloacid dehalogenase